VISSKSTEDSVFWHFLKRFEQLPVVFIARSAIEFIVIYPVHPELVEGFLHAVRYAPLARLRRTIVHLPHKFFENTRDCGNGELTMVSTRLPKNF
jgi:predicted AAA+ superfamily ATPase